jgi:hypothetical protein
LALIEDEMKQRLFIHRGHDAGNGEEPGDPRRKNTEKTSPSKCQQLGLVAVIFNDLRTRSAAIRQKGLRDASSKDETT